MKKILFAALSCTLCLSFMTGCSKSFEDDKEINYITMDSFNENDKETSTVDEGLSATIYTTDEEALNLIEKKVNVIEMTPEYILAELISYQYIPVNTRINSFKTYTEGELTIGVIDFSNDFYNFNLGSGFESMMLDSIAKTYIENFELDKFKILVDGSEYQSGHILLDEDYFFTLENLNYQ